MLWTRNLELREFERLAPSYVAFIWMTTQICDSVSYTFFKKNLAMPSGLWDLSSLIRDQTQAPAMRTLEVSSNVSAGAEQALSPAWP